MSMEIYENRMQKLAIYQDIEISEQQIKNNQVKDARSALTEIRVNQLEHSHPEIKT